MAVREASIYASKVRTGSGQGPIRVHCRSRLKTYLAIKDILARVHDRPACAQSSAGFAGPDVRFMLLSDLVKCLMMHK